eukprot:9086471-Pyramimonas_sp.AAC.1
MAPGLIEQLKSCVLSSMKGGPGARRCERKQPGRLLHLARRCQGNRAGRSERGRPSPRSAISVVFYSQPRRLRALGLWGQ